MKDCSLRYSHSDKGQCHAFFNCLLGEIEFLSGVHTEEFRIATPQFAAHQPLIYTRNDGVISLEQIDAYCHQLAKTLG